MAERIVTGVCANHCNADGCIYQATIRNNKVISIDEHPTYRMGGCAKLMSSKERYNDPNRAVYPLQRVGDKGEGKWQRISWDEALDATAGRLNQIKAKCGYPVAPSIEIRCGQKTPLEIPSL